MHKNKNNIKANKITNKTITSIKSKIKIKIKIKATIMKMKMKIKNYKLL